MFSHRYGYFYRLTKSFPILKYFDLYDHQSFIRDFVLDNIYVCLFMYFLFYFGLWYANKVIKKVEQSNEEMFAVVQDNRQKLDDVVTLKNKRAEYEDVVVKAKGAQRVTAIDLDNEMKKLSVELAATENKIGELETVLGKFKTLGYPITSGMAGHCEGESPEGVEATPETLDDLKVLEPSFPPPLPPQPPPRKYGIFVSRPPGHRTGALTPPGYRSPSSSPGTPPPKIGFK